MDAEILHAIGAGEGVKVFVAIIHSSGGSPISNSLRKESIWTLPDDLQSPKPRNHEKSQKIRDKFLHGILHLRNPNLGPNSGKRILGARILDPNSWVEFVEPVFFQEKRPPEKFTFKKFTSQNSPSKIQPRNRAKKFTLHLCRAF